MIEIIQADITSLHVDAIVNAANNSLLGGGGVDGAIHKAAGPELLQYNLTLDGCETGQAKIAPGFKLNAKWVIHTVGPVWMGGKKAEYDLLTSCYLNTFQLALKNYIETIAFPGVSTGIYGFPKVDAARIALSTMLKFEPQFKKIIACCFCSEDIEIYNNELMNFQFNQDIEIV